MLELQIHIAVVAEEVLDDTQEFRFVKVLAGHIII